jgi:hypothetical protein
MLIKNNWEQSRVFLELNEMLCDLGSNLLIGFTGLGSLNLGNSCSTLGTQNTTTPVTAELVVSLIEVGLDGFQKFCKLTSVTTLNLGSNNVNK